MTVLELNLVMGVRVILLVVMTGVALAMIVKLPFAWRKLSLGQKLYFLGSFCIVLYADDAMRDAIVHGLAWRWRLVPGFIGAACLFGWVLEPWELQRRLWGQPPFSPPPERRNPPD